MPPKPVALKVQKHWFIGDLAVPERGAILVALPRHLTYSGPAHTMRLFRLAGAPVGGPIFNRFYILLVVGEHGRESETDPYHR